MSVRWVLGSVVAILGSAAAFVLLDPVVAAFVAIVLGTLAVLVVVAGDWDSHSTYEERELARARRRKEKWERGAAARARDRAKWEVHRARQEAKNSAQEQ